MSRTKQFLSGVALTYLYQGCVMLLGLWLTPFYLRHLGSHDYGIWLVGLQVLGFLLLCDLGVLAVTPRDVAAAHGRELSDGDPGPLRQLVGRTAKSVLVQTVLVVIVAGVLFLFRPAGASELRGPIGLVLLLFALTFPLRAASAVLQGLQDLKFLGTVRIWLWGIAAALTVILLLAGARFYALAIGWCVQEAGSTLVSVVRLRLLRPDLCNRTTWRQAGTFQWRWLARGLWISVAQVSSSLVGGTDLMIVARFLGPATVVIYSCTGKLVQVLQQQPGVLASMAVPGLSQMNTSVARERIVRTVICLTEAMLFVAGAIVCVVLPLNRQFVHLWVGSEYFGGILLTSLFLANFLLRLIDYTLALALFALGHEKMLAIRALCDGLFSVSLAAILARPLGLEGVILGFLCGGVLIAVPMDLYRFTRDFNMSLWAALRPYVPYLWRIAALMTGAFLLLRDQPISNLAMLAVYGTAIGLAYVLITAPYLRKSELSVYLWPMLSKVPILRRLLPPPLRPSAPPAEATDAPEDENILTARTTD